MFFFIVLAPDLYKKHVNAHFVCITTIGFMKRLEQGCHVFIEERTVVRTIPMAS